eukprot:TRINITY_DN35366_c0_g1_i1.p1 TRINITY_DN35366_c0_g1~~TRINITY_DN35366_c0_g1_i1.p1  ORF type:complete len:504 (-),score=118.79 TRINITY_DN35366_c0_g1_i1:136-1647(-)
MSTAAEAAKEFATGPQVIQAVHKLLESFPVVKLCEALANARPEDAEHLIAALERLTDFSEVRKDFLHGDVVGFLGQGASAADPRLRLLVAKLIGHLAKGGEAHVTGLADTGLLGLCDKLLLDEETSIGEAGAKIVLNAADASERAFKELVGTAPGDGNSLVERLDSQLAGMKDVHKIRVLSLVIELGRISESTFALFESRGSFEKVLGSFLTDDLLLKLVSVELMDALASYPAGQDFLSKRNLPEQIAQELQDPCCDDSIRLSVTRLLGLVLGRTPEAANALLTRIEAPFPQSVAGCLGSRDHAMKICALKAWADASAQLQGLEFFLKWTPLMEDIVSSVGSSQNEVSKAAMHCWSNVLQIRSLPVHPNAGGQPSPEAERQLWEIAEQYVLPLALKNLTSKPFADVRPHTYHLLAVLVRSRKAAQQSLPSEELRTLLLDFTSETNSEARVAKHELVKALVHEHGNWLGNYLDPEVEQLMQEWAKQNPHWMPERARVSVGDAGA